MFEVLPKLNSATDEPLYIQIYNYIKDEILSGRVPPGSKLPSIRELSKDLRLSKNTIESAYEQLIAEGYVKSKDRSGLYVEFIESSIGSIRSVSVSVPEVEIDKAHEYSIKYDFRSGLVDTELFPYTEFRRIMTRCIDSCSKETLLYGDHKGDMGLRNEISRYLHYSRGVACTAGQIIVSAGTQQSLALLSLILSKLGCSIAFEEPGYLGAREVFRHFGLNVIPIPLDTDGINIGYLKESTTNVAYVTPSHQFPNGMVMPISKRLSLIQWAKDCSGYVIEDDYDGEFKYKGRPIPSLQGLDDTGRIIYLGSFSKSLMPSMRISYLVLPEKLLSVYEKYFKVYEQTVSRIVQKSLEIFMSEGSWEKHLKRSRVLYNKKREVLINSITEHLGENVSVKGTDSGLHILLEVKSSLIEEELIEKALNSGVKVNPTLIYWLNPPPDSLPMILIGYAGIKIEDIPEGIRLLKKCWF